MPWWPVVGRASVSGMLEVGGTRKLSHQGNSSQESAAYGEFGELRFLWWFLGDSSMSSVEWRHPEPKVLVFLEWVGRSRAIHPGKCEATDPISKSSPPTKNSPPLAITPQPLPPSAPNSVCRAPDIRAFSRYQIFPCCLRFRRTSTTASQEPALRRQLRGCGKRGDIPESPALKVIDSARCVFFLCDANSLFSCCRKWAHYARVECCFVGRARDNKRRQKAIQEKKVRRLATMEERNDSDTDGVHHRRSTEVWTHQSNTARIPGPSNSYA